MSQQLEQFGKYLLLEKLATGGMAEVYLAKSVGAVGVNKFVAIKRILPQHSESQEYIDMFKEEAKIAVNLNHGNVVSIYDFGVEYKQFFLVMEHVEGRNLRQIVNEMKKSNVQFSIDQIVYIAKEVAAGLDHAHRCIDGTTGRPLNITHRDMSPQNIMVSFEGEVKIIDFGIAKAETQMEATKAGTLKGKFGYMSPEQADGMPIDLRTDIFSLGIVLWELLANDRLFTSSSEAAILRKIRECQIPSIRKINPSVPPELERIVNKALAKDKSLRYQTAAALHRDLNRFLNTQYPEFSPHDFSVFVKTAFSQIYLEQKRRLVEYAKLSVQTQDDKTLITRTVGNKTEVVAHIAQIPNQAPTTVVTSPGSLPGLGGDSSFTVEDNELGIKVDGNDVKINLDSLKSGTDAPSARKQFYKGESERKHALANNTRVTNTYTSTKLRTGSSQSALIEQAVTWGLIGIVAIGSIFGGWYFYNTPSGGRMVKSLLGEGEQIVQSLPKQVDSPRPAQQPVPDATQKTDQASSAPPQQYTILLVSEPNGARVFINGEDTGAFTPNRRSLEAHKDYVVTLKKEGYMNYEGTIRASQNGSTFTMSMQPAQKAAYISITVANGGLNTVIYVNGIRLGEKPPISKYAIPAGTPVRITAYDPFYKLSAEQVVRVDANQKKSVDLILGVDQRKPSGQ
ncbi:protein kinase domain-containing protein [Bdellovibrio sp. HCB337]|uniref:protein kinase domain-containing protein n=1 Tax=Bdellovibrio sp. HCB337 TaxID=3394358 RepID=UPI0039A706D0